MGQCFKSQRGGGKGRADAIPPETKPAITYKIVLVGAPDAGKTTFVCNIGRIEESALKSDKPVSYQTSVDTGNGSTQVVNLFIYDTLGAELYKTITSTFYEGAKGVLILYDIHDKLSYEECGTWFREAERYASTAKFILVGNKTDLSTGRKITKEAAKEFALERNAGYFEVSALSGDNIKTTIDEFARIIYLSEKQRESQLLWLALHIWKEDTIIY